jgi:hypothetical protein
MGLALGVFVLLTLTSYTSNLTNILVQKTFSVRFDDIKQAVDLGVPICIIPNRVENLLIAHPRAIVARDPEGNNLVEGRNDVFKLVEEGKCTVGLAYLEDYQTYTAPGSGQSSGRLTRAGDPVLFGLVGIPIADSPVGQAVQYRVQGLLSSGVYDELKRTAMPAEAGTDMFEEDVSFSMQDMMGVFVMTGLLVLLGLLISAGDFMCKRHRRITCKQVNSQCLEPVANDGVREISGHRISSGFAETAL